MALHGLDVVTGHCTPCHVLLQMPARAYCLYPFLILHLCVGAGDAQQADEQEKLSLQPGASFLEDSISAMPSDAAPGTSQQVPTNNVDQDYCTCTDSLAYSTGWHQHEGLAWMKCNHAP